MPRRRLRTFTLWTGTTLCVLIAAAFVVSWHSYQVRLQRLRTEGHPIWDHLLEFPLFFPLLAVPIPTLLAWRFWPKPPKPGHCECGYDLTGNVSGTCPECGRETDHA